MRTSPAAFIVGAAILIIVVWDAFESIILPRRVTRRFRLTRLFYKTTWKVWNFASDLIPSRKVRESAMGVFGPISLLILVAVWAVGLVLSFGVMQYGAGSGIYLKVACMWVGLCRYIYLVGASVGAL